LTARGLEAPTWNLGGFPHEYAYGLGSWVVLGLLVITMIAYRRERHQSIYLIGAVGAIATICPLVAGQFEAQVATASAWRWMAALFLLAGTAMVWFANRIKKWFGQLDRAAVVDPEMQGYRPWSPIDRVTNRHLCRLVLTSTLMPLLALVAFPALRAIFYRPVHGPSSGFFYLIGETTSYAIPLLIAALCLIAIAVRERLASYAFSGGWLLNLAVTMVYLLSVVAAHGNMDRAVLIRVIQLQAITGVLYAMIWLSLHDRWRRALKVHRRSLAELLLQVQIGLAVAGNAAVLLTVAIHLLVAPARAGLGTAAAGDAYGWLAFGLTVLSSLWFGRVYRKSLTVDAIAAILVALTCLLAFSMAELGSWDSLHIFGTGLAVATWLICLARSLPQIVSKLGDRSKRAPWRSIADFIGLTRLSSDWQWNSTLYASLLGVVTVFVGLRATADDPIGGWWSIAILIVTSGLAAAINWQTSRRAFLWVAGLLFSLAVSVWWSSYVSAIWPQEIDFVMLNVAASALCAIVCLWLELQARRDSERAERQAGPSFHDFVAICSLIFLIPTTLMMPIDRSIGQPVLYSIALMWAAIISAGMLMFACLWDKRAKYAVGGLYLLGLSASAIGLERLELPAQQFIWASQISLSLYALVTSLCWYFRAPLFRWSRYLRMPERTIEAERLNWLQIFNVALILSSLAMACWIDLYSAEFALRATAAMAIAVQGITMALMAPASNRRTWQRTALAIFALGLALAGGSWLQPGLNGTWLNRAVILMAEMFALVALFGLGLPSIHRRLSEWAGAIHDCVPWAAGIGLLSLSFVLGTEIAQQLRFGAVLIGTPAIAVVSITLVAMTIVLILFALSSRHDPLTLDEGRRQLYVYGAECMLALLFMHLRLTMPWLFTGFFERYWPFVVLAIAFFGVITSEVLHRRRILVLAHPIERTGAFLPLLPVLGFWLHSEADYSLVLFIVGGLYGLLSILRRSFGFGLLAALGGNGGLWYVWHRTDEYGFIQHPQLWLIPAALTVLLAVHLHREDFSERQLTSVRYLVLATIYSSSSADIFINGVGHSPWLPMILAGLSIMGVFAGIMFRVRASLMLGSVFLLFSIATMIKYASVNFGWTWLWWVAGIVSGALIIFTFALFEKKRDEALRVIDGLKEWQS